jgi:hypothetical protein
MLQVETPLSIIILICKLLLLGDYLYDGSREQPGGGGSHRSTIGPGPVLDFVRGLQVLKTVYTSVGSAA